VSAPRKLRLGFIPLNDAAPLVVAKQQGFFAAEGLEVELAREPSWANIRDTLAAGAIDGAHMLAPMAIAATLGAGSEPLALIAPFALSYNGAAFTVSAALAKAVAGEGLAAVARARRAAGAPLRFAVVFPYSTHNYLLRDWLAGQGLDPDADVRITVTPPPRMGEQLASGVIDGFCAGEPWNALAVANGNGVVLMRSAEAQPGRPDKVLGVTAAFAEAEGESLAALIRALARAAAWAGRPDNRPQLAALLARPEYVAAPEALIAVSLADIAFAEAGRPHPDHQAWLLEQMVRWGQVELGPRVVSVYRPDLFDAALAAKGG
jgi:NitT/TauT family transport system ATP-binding protein/nitrate/nitrite transport system substrate-binding protein